MDKTSFTRLIADIYLYFDRKMPEKEQTDLWFDDLSFIPVGAIDRIKDHFKSLDKWPQNPMRQVRIGFSQYKGINKIAATYDKYDDPTFPMEFLWKGLDVLSQKGEATFLGYCEQVKMPAQDVERIKNKHGQVFIKEQRKKGGY